MHIRSAAVLGAGTMGAQIAAHLANAGVPVLLLDVNRTVAREGFDRARKIKPDPFFTPAAQALVRTGGFEEDLPSIATADWIVEAIVERLDLKQALLERVERHRAAAAIVSSNTSGIPIASIGEGRSEAFRRHWLGTHFFNPPRYLRLLEVIPSPHTDPAVTETIAQFAADRLGKGVVVAKDTPNFIANHLGLYGVMQIFRALQDGLHRRRNRCDDRARDRPAEERNVPHDGSRGDRRARACRRAILQSASPRPRIARRLRCRRSSPSWSAAAGLAQRLVRASTRRRRTARS